MEFQKYYLQIVMAIKGFCQVRFKSYIIAEYLSQCVSYTRLLCSLMSIF